jgi:hypothetical protein
MENIERELKCQLHKEGFEELKDYFDREFVLSAKSAHLLRWWTVQDDG